jgi:hypothetical protein
MMKTRTRRARWAALGLIACAIIAAAALSVVRARASSWCEDCYEWNSELTGLPDAQCCIEGGYCGYLPEYAFPIAMHVEYCWLVQDEDGGWSCAVGVPQCEGGGGGGGGSCHIGFGELCPAECFSCIRTY